MRESTPTQRSVHDRDARRYTGVGDPIMQSDNAESLELLVDPLGDVPNLGERVLRRLRELLVAGTLPSGTRLRQRELAKQLGVSQTPVRDSLLQLEAEGLVTMGHNGRAFASRLTREDLEELYAMRLGLEGLAVRLGTERVTDADVATMQSLLAEIGDLASLGDVTMYLSRRWEFHATCYRAAQRPRLLLRVERLFWAAERYNKLLLSTPERFDQSLANYSRFLEAVEARDGSRAEHVFQDSARWAVEILTPLLPLEAQRS